ncbi:MAG: RICIN domain-containing protein [Opitutales bacterium]|nr:RICIN domain-containing protein [Opitutales bacterium]
MHPPHSLRLIALAAFLMPVFAAAHIIGERLEDAALIDPEASYVLVNKHTGAVIDSEGRTVTNLANLYPAVNDGSTFQMWRFEPRPTGSFYIFNRANDKVILVPGGSKNPGVSVVQDRNRNSLRNDWRLEAGDGGYFRIVNRNSDLPLAVSDPAHPTGADIIQTTVAAHDTQLWAVHRAEAPFTEAPDFSMRGFATHGAGVTGGAGGDLVVVSTAEELKRHIARAEPLVILVEGTIDLPSNPDTPHSNPNHRMYTVASNKTIIGLPGAHIRYGGFNIRSENVIIRNLTFSGAHDDSINIEHGGSRVWIDHNEFFDGADGLVDIKRESDFITVSWNILRDHDKTALLGHDDNHTADRGHLRVTYHHNWFRNSEQRNPRVRYARTHVFNNLYEDIGGYCIGIGVEAQIISEANYVVSANSGYRLYDKASQPGFFRDTDSVFSGLNNDLDETTDSGIDWDPSDYYTAAPNHVLNVPHLVRNFAGPGVLTLEELGVVIDPPSVLQAPLSRTANIGTSTTFTVVAGGTGPLFYAWSHNGQPLDGADGPELTLHGITLVDAGEYAVTVSNGFGESDSASAYLTVDPTVLPPTFENPPQSKSVADGGTAIFHAGANGTAPLTYLWQRDGAVIDGEENASLVLTNVAEADAAVYTVTVSNAAGSITSAPFFLAVPPPPAAPLVNDTFADGNRGGQSPPESLAWFTSSGSSNFTATVGAATQQVSSSRTLLAYFTDSSANPVVPGLNQKLVFEFDFRFSGFDSGQDDGAPTLRAALLRSVANPAATSGTGFTASGATNTNARVHGDFGSNNPSNRPFDLYEGYTALAVVQGSVQPTAGYLARRDNPHAALLGNLTAFTQVGPDASPPLTMTANTAYRGRLSVLRMEQGHLLRFSVVRISDSATIMEFEALDTTAAFSAFDTVAFHLSKAGSSSNYNFVLNGGSVWLESTADTSTFAGWIDATGLPPGLRAPHISPTGDGVANVFKFIVGLDPLTPSTSPFQHVQHSAGNEQYLALAFPRRQNTGDITLTVQTATDLAFATNLGSVEVSATPRGDGTDDVLVRSAVPLSEAPRQFIRVVAE